MNIISSSYNLNYSQNPFENNELALNQFFKEIKSIISKELDISEAMRFEHSNFQKQTVLILLFDKIFDIFRKDIELFKENKDTVEQLLINIVHLIFNKHFEKDMSNGKMNIIFGEGQSQLYFENIYTSFLFINKLLENNPEIKNFNKLLSNIINGVQCIYVDKEDYLNNSYLESIKIISNTIFKFNNLNLIKKTILDKNFLNCLDNNLFSKSNKDFFDYSKILLEQSLLNKALNETVIIKQKNNQKI